MSSSSTTASCSIGFLENALRDALSVTWNGSVTLGPGPATSYVSRTPSAVATSSRVPFAVLRGEQGVQGEGQGEREGKGGRALGCGTGVLCLVPHVIFAFPTRRPAALAQQHALSSASQFYGP